MIKIILIKDKWAINDTLTTNEYVSYLGLSMLLRKNLIDHYVNSHYLAYLLSGKYIISGKFVNAICNGIVGLADKKMIKIKQRNDKDDEWIINLSQMKNENKKNNEDTEFYSILDENDIHKIIQSNDSYYTKSISLVKFYSYVVSTISKTDSIRCVKGVGFTSIANMSSTTGYNTKTVSAYLKLLEDLKLIYIFRSKDRIKFETGEIVEISHTYGRYDDKDRIIATGKSHEDEYGMKTKAKVKKIAKAAGDNTRRYSQKFLFLERCLKEGKDNPYTYSECKEIYQKMYELNNRYEKEKRGREPKDLSIFSEYDFYKDG